MTDTQKRAVGERMTKYWAKRRKEKATKAASSRASKAAKPAANA